MSRRVLVFTGTRAEYGLLRGVVAALRERGADTHLLVSGSHLSAAHGATVEEIRRDDLAPCHLADIGLGDDSDVGVCRSMGRALAAYGEILDRLRPAVLVILGDRYEAFCAAAAASICRVPVAHIHGGEVTQGAVDEAFRHCITKMAHLHFASCPSARRRILQLGEAPARVWDVGALGVENVHRLELLAESAVREVLAIPAPTPYCMATYHPVTLDERSGRRQLEALLDALAELPEVVTVFTGANADMGGGGINAVLRDRAATDARLRFVDSLGVLRYLSACRFAAGVVGNSSSGVLEIPSLGVPVLDIGLRQAGRERSPAVLHCDPEPAALSEALHTLLTPETRRRAAATPNPYDKPGTAATIAAALLETPLDGIVCKEFHDVRC